MLNSSHVLDRLTHTMLVLGLIFMWSCQAAQAQMQRKKSPTVIALPGGAGGIGFDDLRYFPSLHKVVVPAAGTGDLDLIDPRTNEVTAISNVAKKAAAPHGDDKGSTSVAYGAGYLFAGDHARVSVAIVDPNKKTVISRQKLAAGYDFIRYVASRHELWVTEPSKHQIEIFKVSKETTPTLHHEALIKISGGPEALVIDNGRNRAYTDLRSNRTLAISLSKRRIVSRWPNSCHQSRGLARHGKFLFVACSEGAAVDLNLERDGKKVSKAKTGQGVDLIAYNRKRHYLYVPGAHSATLTVLRVSSSGHFHRGAVYHAVKGVHCVATTPSGAAFVCDPKQGRILKFTP